ncbi:uncharacterized protein M421DRAFT_394595 [Didymella exigua CBS 183.55]|uniref:Uncharacterized protein n=1 Tax=Didymella exigua CBS 183.55 TaxID=1150837 RepID=A0A6A5RF52_9PLEO|nr:uncharacterized protein M421DRAFT_394595 [Didymella exigua CBS 183.55]KAF1926931.1 hypothetical protein M421DRAFT_394595 [Didymella exigua CBS 183.55]
MQRRERGSSEFQSEKLQTHCSVVSIYGRYRQGRCRERQSERVQLTAVTLVGRLALLLKERNAYLAGGIEVTTLINVDTIVTSGSIDTEVTVEVTWKGAMSVKAQTKFAGSPRECTPDIKITYQAGGMDVEIMVTIGRVDTIVIAGGTEVIVETCMTGGSVCTDKLFLIYVSTWIRTLRSLGAPGSGQDQNLEHFRHIAAAIDLHREWNGSCCRKLRGSGELDYCWNGRGGRELYNSWQLNRASGYRGRCDRAGIASLSNRRGGRHSTEFHGKAYTGRGTWVIVENKVLAGRVCVLVESCTDVLVMYDVAVTLKVCAGSVTG